MSETEDDFARDEEKEPHKHKGSFAEGEETLPRDEKKGSFAEGEETLPRDEHEGSFAEGEENEPHERKGSFGDTDEND
jgi:hypothetical protein